MPGITTTGAILIVYILQCVCVDICIWELERLRGSLGALDITHIFSRKSKSAGPKKRTGWPKQPQTLKKVIDIHIYTLYIVYMLYIYISIYVWYFLRYVWCHPSAIFGPTAGILVNFGLPETPDDPPYDFNPLLSLHISYFY